MCYSGTVGGSQENTSVCCYAAVQTRSVEECGQSRNPIYWYTSSASGYTTKRWRNERRQVDFIELMTRKKRIGEKTCVAPTTAQSRLVYVQERKWEARRVRPESNYKYQSCPVSIQVRIDWAETLCDMMDGMHRPDNVMQLAANKHD